MNIAFNVKVLIALFAIVAPIAHAQSNYYHVNVAMYPINASIPPHWILVSEAEQEVQDFSRFWGLGGYYDPYSGTLMHPERYPGDVLEIFFYENIDTLTTYYLSVGSRPWEGHAESAGGGTIDWVAFFAPPESPYYEYVSSPIGGQIRINDGSTQLPSLESITYSTAPTTNYIFDYLDFRQKIDDALDSGKVVVIRDTDGVIDTFVFPIGSSGVDVTDPNAVAVLTVFYETIQVLRSLSGQ